MILANILERSVQQALKVSGADLWIFIEKPISAILLAIGVLVILLPLMKWAWKRFLVTQQR